MNTVRLWLMAGSLTLALCVAGAAVVSGQGGVELSVSGGFAAPVGDFGDEVGEAAGLAQWGFGLGADVGVPIHAVSGMTWTSTLEGVTFGVDEDVIGEVTADLPVDVDLGRSWGALLFTGIGYSVPVNPGLSVRGVGQVGAGLVKSPGATFTAMGETIELATNWEPARGFSIGLGATVNDRFTLDARFIKLINPEITGELSYQGTTEELSGEQPMSWLQVMAGMRIF